MHIHLCSLSNKSQYSMHGRIVDLWRYRATSGKRNFIERIKVPIFLETVLAIDMM